MAKEFPDFNITPPENVTSVYSDTCMKDGFEVPKADVHCEKRVGCRAIQKTGQCCPDYQCGKKNWENSFKNLKFNKFSISRMRERRKDLWQW